MKLIIAIIQPEELPAIKEALVQREIYKFTVTNALGQGLEYPIHEVYRGIAHDMKLLKKVRLEIAVNDDYVEKVIEAVSSVAKTAPDGGRGKLFIIPIEEVIRLRTGEKGKVAVG